MAQDQTKQNLEKANELNKQAMVEFKKKYEQDREAAYLAQEQMNARAAWERFADKVRKSDKLKHPRQGGPETKWEEVDELINNIINSDQKAYNDWRSNMFDLLNLFTKLNGAINTSSNQVSFEALDLIKKTTKPIPYVRAITHPDEFIYRAAKSAILHKIKGEGEFELDALKHKVTFEEGKVKIADLTKSDGTLLDKKYDSTGRVIDANDADKAFKTFVQLWLQENDYIRSSQDGVFVHEASGAVLDEDTFNRLKSDPVKGLAKFLEENANFTYEEQQEQRSQMTPS
ncbi:hypothetical protein [Legionella bozemanae]|uniref:hypothetical protein n=1 Tax=Legionella bozemanae TaxID=447 RepID=UPI001041A118|nr:hypothetical protein [Legionella bozemanae]